MVKMSEIKYGMLVTKILYNCQTLSRDYFDYLIDDGVVIVCC